MQSLQCVGCQHYLGDRHCKAYPFDGPEIPEAIVLGEHDHRKPFKGDKGIRWEPAPGFEDLADDE